MALYHSCNFADSVLAWKMGAELLSLALCEHMIAMGTIYEGDIHLISHKITEMYDDPQLSGYIEPYFIMRGCTIVVEYHFLEHWGKYPQATLGTLSKTERIAAALGTIRKAIDRAGCAE